MPASVDVFEAIHTARMLRVLKPDPVPDALIQRILEAAISAPSAGNAQAWSFIAVTDEMQRRRLGDAYRRASVSVRDFYVAQGRPAHMSDAEFVRMLRSGIHLHEHMGDAPVIFCRVCEWRRACCRTRSQARSRRSCAPTSCTSPRPASIRPFRT